MRKLALDDDILLNIEKPARYIGGEVNAVMKEKELEAGEIAVRFAMCFPDVYEIGMSHLVPSLIRICSTAETMYGVSVSIHHGWISTRS